MRTIIKRYLMIVGLTLTVFMGDMLQAPAAMAAGDWRPIYDAIMMWVNFVILAVVLFKLLRQPLGNFLTAQRDAVKHTLETLENEKTRIEEDIQSLRAMLEGRQQRAVDLNKRMVAAGEEERRALIAEARREAERRLHKARQLIEAHHRDACRKLRDEMIDVAVHRALAELPKHITPELEQVLANRFLRSISNLSE